MKMQVLISKSFVLLLIGVFASFGIQGMSYGAPGGVCEVGDVLSPGQSCTYPGTETEFRVLDDGSGQFLFATADTALNLRDTLVNGKPYTFAANKREGNWVIEALGGIVDLQAPPIFWTDQGTDKIQRMNLDGTSVEDLITIERGILGGIALDVAGDKMYWADWGFPSGIQYANLDGSNVQTLVNTDDDPWDIALDVAEGKVYWTVGPIVEDGQGKIQRANLDGTNVETLVSGLIKNPDYITLDVTERKMYWSMAGYAGDTNESKIQRANLDGTNVEDVIPSLQFGLPGGIALAVGDGKIYWTNWGPPEGIQCANLDGSNAQTLVNTDDNPWDIALDAAGGKVYWTLGPISVDGHGKIQRANLDGTNVETLVWGLDTPRYIALAIPSLKTPESTGTGQIVRADVNGDGTVNIQDLIIVVTNLGKQGENAADVNTDGIVNIQDLVLVAGVLGQGDAAAPSLHTDFLGGISTADVQGWLSEAQQMNRTDPRARRGVLFLEKLLAALLPQETTLLANYPNPFNPETWIPYQLAKPADVKVAIYATDGALVRTLALGHQATGVYQSRGRAAYWDGRNALGEPVASGVYFYTLTAGEFIATRRMLVLK